MSTPGGNAGQGTPATPPPPAPSTPSQPAPPTPPAPPSLVEAVRQAVAARKQAEAQAAAKREEDAKAAALTTLGAVLTPADPSRMALHVVDGGVLATSGPLHLLVRSDGVWVAEKHELGGWRARNPPLQVKVLADLAGPLGVD